MARALQRRNPSATVVVLERESEIASHQTSHNSGVIHAGLYYRPGSLKATLCRRGADAMYSYCDERGIAAKRCGKLVIARSENELQALDALERRARANGVPGLARLRHDEIAAFEPNARGVAALHSPFTGVADFGRVASALADDVREHDGAVITGCGVHSAQPSGRNLIVTHDRGELRTGFAVFCAGAWSDRLALRCGAALDYRIVPFRGAYLQLRRERSDLVRGLIYPVPDPRLPFLGVHISRHIDGRVTIGPTALPVFSRTAYRLGEVRPPDAVDTLRWPGTWRMAKRWWRTGMNEIADAVSRRALVTKARAYVPALALDDFTPDSDAGIRAQAVARDGTLLDDFVFARSPLALHVCNAPSPAATASLALAEHIVDVVQEARDST